MTDTAIFGAGGLGRLVLDILLQSGRYRPVCFLDNDPARHGTLVDGLRVRGGLSAFDQLVRAGVNAIVVAIGDNHTRVRIAEMLRERGAQLLSAIHPLASISPTAALGEHLIIGPRANICVHAAISAHCVILAGAIVEHENTLGTGVFLHPAVRLAGGVTIADLATLAIGACVIPGRRVGHAASVEPGSVVIRDVPPGATVGGIPARLRHRTLPRFVPDASAIFHDLPARPARPPLAPAQ